MVLNPSHALYRENAYLLREDPRVTRPSLYYSLLNAVAGGASGRSRIAAAIGKKASDLDHPLNVLLSAGFLRKEDDFLSQRAPSYLIADPIIRFHELITRNHEALEMESRGVRFSRSARYLVFSLAGFTVGLRKVAGEREEVELVDLPRIYEGE
jgi:hypothetical protein